MNNKLTPFQAIIFGVLVVAIIVGVLIFSLRRQSSNEQNVPLTMWGTVDEAIVKNYVSAVNKKYDKAEINLTYVQYQPEVFESELVEALAAGVGPDMVLMPNDLLIKHENKIFLASYDFYPQKDFKERFIESGEILLRDEGILGLPLMVDPLVMYWNRTLLNNAGISKPPAYWDEFLTMVPELVDKDASLNIENAGVAMGEFRNIKNAKEIFVTLLMQAGNKIIVNNDSQVTSKKYLSVFESRAGYSVTPAEAAINFFTQFSNPTKDLYSWNRSLPDSQEMFLAGDLAFYLGFASEIQDIRSRNPNLNFDVTVVPQSRSSDEKVVFGRLYGMSIMKSSPNIGPAFSAMLKLTEADNLKELSNYSILPSVHRSLLVDVPEFSYLQVFNDSALISRSFLDPDPVKTESIFSDMIGDYTSGRSRLVESIRSANTKINEILQ